MKKNKLPTVFIGIVTFNSERYIIACLSMVRKQTYPNIQTIVLDNNSNDNTRTLISSYIDSEKFIRNTKNVGYGTAHNATIRLCHLKQSDYYMPLNPDVVLDPSYVENLVFELIRNKADWGTGKLYMMNSYRHKKKILYSAGHALFLNGYVVNIGYGMHNTKELDTSTEVFGAPGAAPLYSGKLIKRVAYKEGLFDKYMFMYYEDVDVDWRARLNGLRCWCACTAIGYHVGSTPRGRINTQAIANRYLSVIKNAFVYDLLRYNIMTIFLHCVFMLCFNPVEGVWLIQRLTNNIPRTLKRRTVPNVSRSYMMQWFLLNKRRSTSQPKTFLQRLMNYFRR